MTKKHYEALAELNREAFESGLMSARSYGQFCRLAAERMGRFNSAFNEYQFLKACGVVG